MSIIITDYIARRVTTSLTPDDQAELIRVREADALAHRQARAQLSTEQLIQAGEDAVQELFS